MTRDRKSGFSQIVLNFSFRHEIFVFGGQDGGGGGEEEGLCVWGECMIYSRTVIQL